MHASAFPPLLRCVCAIVVTLLACKNPTAEATRAKASRPPELPPSSDPLDQTLAHQAAKFAGGMVVHDNAFRADLGENEQHDFLVVLNGGHCYKAIGVGDTNVGDLDVSLVDPNGMQVQQDVARDAYPVLGQEAPLCITESGAYRMHVRMRSGSGTFLVRFFKTDE